MLKLLINYLDFLQTHTHIINLFIYIFYISVIYTTHLNIMKKLKLYITFSTTDICFKD